MKIVTLVGTRPELIKLSEIIKKFDEYTDHVFVHTGQNYDYELNEIFYKDLDLRKPDYYLNVIGESLGKVIGNVIREFEMVLVKEKPDAVVILGDTNSALGGIVAKRMKIPLFHLEAGNRSFDDNVPEEINRRILDHISDVNLAYTENSRRYLMAEGIAKDRTFLMGSPMKEVLMTHYPKIQARKILASLKLKPTQYFLVSLHRDENVENEANLDELLMSY
jgi:UDP-N-acetylglucosamine 2-epimerase (non-hydrolysing)